MSESRPEPDVIDLLTDDHHQVLELLEQLQQSTDPELRRELADIVIGELVRHSVAEEMFVYPAMRRHLPEGSEVVDRDIAEHKELESIMKRWEGLDPATGEFGQLMIELERVLRDHVRDEETEQFPQLRQHIPARELSNLAVLVESAKQVAPTRPHPLSPNNQLFHFVVGPGVGLVDRLRDAWTDRPRTD